MVVLGTSGKLAAIDDVAHPFSITRAILTLWKGCKFGLRPMMTLAGRACAGKSRGLKLPAYRLR